MLEIVVYYVLPNVVLFGSIFLLSQWMESFYENTEE